MKSDVYGFGVVLLEMLTGLRALDNRRPAGQVNLVDWKKPYLYHKKKLKFIMDPRIEGQYSSKAAAEAAELTLRCLEQEPKKRPSMKEVGGILEQIEARKVKPKVPRIVSSHSSSIPHHSSRHNNSGSGTGAGRYQK